jgi:hypothetical protein
VVKLLEGFHKAPLLHQIKNVNLQRPLTPGPQQRTNEVDVRLNIEALIITDTRPRKALLPEAKVAGNGDGPVFHVSLADPGREYLSIPEKNIFFGPSLARRERADPNWEVLGFVHLTDITTNERARRRSCTIATTTADAARAGRLRQFPDSRFRRRGTGRRQGDPHR